MSYFWKLSLPTQQINQQSPMDVTNFNVVFNSINFTPNEIGELFSVQNHKILKLFLVFYFGNILMMFIKPWATLGVDLPAALTAYQHCVGIVWWVLFHWWLFPLWSVPFPCLHMINTATHPFYYRNRWLCNHSLRVSKT